MTIKFCQQFFRVSANFFFSYLFAFFFSFRLYSFCCHKTCQCLQTMREQSLKMCAVCGRGRGRRAKQDAKFVSIKCGSLLGAESCSSVLFVRCEGNGKGDCPQSPTSILFATCVWTWCVCVDNIVITKRVCAVNNSIKHVSRRTFELRWAQAKIFETGQSNWHFIFPSCPVPSLGHPSFCQL